MGSSFLPETNDLHAILDDIAVGVIVYGADERIIHANPAVTQITGIPADELRSRALRDSRWDVVDENDQTVPPAAFPSTLAFESRKPVRDIVIGVRTYQGIERVWILVSAIPQLDSRGAVLRVVVSFVDITRRREAEGAYRFLAHHATDIVSRVADDGTLLYISPSISSLIGYRPEELMGKSAFNIIHSDDHPGFARLNPITLPDSLSQPVRQTYRLLHRDGTVRWVESMKRILPDPTDPSKFEIQSSCRDITERRHLEDKLQQAAKMEAIGQLAGGVAHDFNNLLTAIIGNLELVELPSSHPDHELIQSSLQAGLRAAELTSQLLGFARRKPLRVGPLDVRRLLAELTGMFARTVDPLIRIEIQTLIDIWPILADAGQLQQVLLNICLNARDAMPSGGLIRLGASNHTFHSNDMHQQPLQSQPGDYVQIMIQDSGDGMSEETRSRIFEPFFTTKDAGKGTGLGLAMAYGIIHQHGGWIDCQSIVGRGTRFELYLPRSMEDPTESGRYPSVELSENAGGKILVIDDEPMVREVGRQMLLRSGYDVITAADALEGIELFRSNRQSIQLILLDLAMPGLSGAEAMVYLRKIDPKIPIVVASGHAAEQVGKLSGIAGFVQKPYSLQDLNNAVTKALRRNIEKSNV
jgi:PAS domain S-box-containing protein